MDRLRLPSFAKLNLGLQVIRREPDGYHQIRTVFQMIDLHDDMTFAAAPAGVRLETAGWEVPTGADNLVLKAAAALAKASRIRTGAVIRLEKRIPVAAGLGGGSSNAATALLGLNRLWEAGKGRRELLALARALGADVPFFLHGGAALGTGRGDRLRPLGATLRLPVLVVCPPVRLSTAEVYRAGGFGLTGNRPRIKMGGFSLALSERASLADLLVNDLERPAFRLRPAARVIKSRLSDLGSVAVSMSGSGPSVFGVFPGREAAEEAARRMRAEGNFCAVSSPMSREEFRRSTRAAARPRGGSR